MTERLDSFFIVCKDLPSGLGEKCNFMRAAGLEIDSCYNKTVVGCIEIE